MKTINDLIKEAQSETNGNGDTLKYPFRISVDMSDEIPTYEKVVALQKKMGLKSLGETAARVLKAYLE